MLQQQRLVFKFGDFEQAVAGQPMHRGSAATTCIGYTSWPSKRAVLAGLILR
jgi:hypothetical protein